jgi:N-methylhydantoinase A/oxoprolinase/acetone carboxylase beta subunit
MKIGIGIDTGGTYTDAVIFDFDEKKILETAKALTTKEDLSLGILAVLDALPAQLLKKAEIISLSTTLATNACVEDRGGNAKLIFFGGDSAIIDKYGKDYGLPNSSEVYIQESFTKFSGELTCDPDWDLFSKKIESEFDGIEGVGIVELNAMRNSAVVEKKAKELFLQKRSIPVVCGHELFSELNSLQRGSSTLLNARLFPVIREFINAIKIAMAKREINASVVIVRSDGSLMSEEFANIRPVETLLCGPVASVLGSARLANEPKSLVVDMGGTTTDIALVNNGIPHKATGGISIGKWKTFVNGLYVKTFGLGGDTAIHYNIKNQPFLEDYRIVPLCVAAEKYPCIIDNLKRLRAVRHTKYLHEHYMLIKDISDNPRYTDEEKTLCNALKNGPLMFKEAAHEAGTDIYNLNVSRLIKEGIIQVCGLTPTDIMHIKGDFTQFAVQASVLGAEFVALNANMRVNELCEYVYDQIKRKLYTGIVKVMLENGNKHFMTKGVSKDIEYFINENYNMAKAGFKNEYIRMMFTTDFVLAGVGAPIHIFLDDVAKMLGTKAVIPKYHEVANALGAIVGNISATYTVEIRPNYSNRGISGFMVFGGNDTKVFKKLEEAEAFAMDEAKIGAQAEAIRRGASGEIAISCTVNKDEGEGRDQMIYLGTQVTALAVGTIGF